MLKEELKEKAQELEQISREAEGTFTFKINKSFYNIKNILSVFKTIILYFNHQHIYLDIQEYVHKLAYY